MAGKSPGPLARKKTAFIFVVSGPSGSGKSTLLERLLQDKALSRRLVKSVSFTTRPKRSGEKNKKDYFFITPEQFSQERKAKKLLEWTRYLGYDYASSRDFIERQLRLGRHILLCLDWKGACRIKRLYPENTVTIFVLPPSLGILRHRIKQRCQKTTRREIQQRLQLARQEFTLARRYDYSLINKKLSQAARDLKAIILQEINA